MLLALLASALGAHAYNRRRKLVLAALVVVLAVAAYRALAPVLRGDWRSVVSELEDEPLTQVLLAPASWFVLTFTAERVWPDLVQYAALALAVDGVLLLLLFALDAHYLEASAGASERQYARLQRLRRGGTALAVAPASGRLRLTAPPLPYLGGVGPILWRQATSFLRSWWSLLLVLLMVGFLSGPLLGHADDFAGDEPPVPLLGSLLLAMTLVVPALLPFDFRGDVDRMDLLKTLPLPAWRLVVGQLLTPVAAVTLVQALVVALMLAVWGRPWPWLLAGCAFLLPVNFLLFGIENLLFLWFPTRLVATTPGDFQLLGRQVLLWLAKFTGLGLLLALALVAGLGGYVVAADSLATGVAAAWLACVGLCTALVPLVAWAFRRFDVTRDTPA